MDDELTLEELRQTAQSAPARPAQAPMAVEVGVKPRRVRGREWFVAGLALIVGGLGVSALAPLGLRLIAADAVTLNVVWGLLGILGVLGTVLLAIGARHVIARLLTVLLVAAFSVWLTLLYVSTIMRFSVLEFFPFVRW